MGIGACLLGHQHTLQNRCSNQVDNLMLLNAPLPANAQLAKFNKPCPRPSGGARSWWRYLAAVVQAQAAPVRMQVYRDVPRPDGRPRPRRLGCPQHHCRCKGWYVCPSTSVAAIRSATGVDPGLVCPLAHCCFALTGAACTSYTLTHRTTYFSLASGLSMLTCTSPQARTSFLPWRPVC